jgi:hypothetical protein
MVAVVQLDVVKKSTLMLTGEHEHLLSLSAERDKKFLVHFGADWLFKCLWTGKNVTTFRQLIDWKFETSVRIFPKGTFIVWRCYTYCSDQPLHNFSQLTV